MAVVSNIRGKNFQQNSRQNQKLSIVFGPENEKLTNNKSF